MLPKAIKRPAAGRRRKGKAIGLPQKLSPRQQLFKRRQALGFYPSDCFKVGDVVLAATDYLLDPEVCSTPIDVTWKICEIPQGADRHFKVELKGVDP